MFGLNSFLNRFQTSGLASNASMFEQRPDSEILFENSASCAPTSTEVFTPN